MTQPLLTVFTPTYNRGHLLPRLYDSLVRQTSRDFSWLIIDDGSTDSTRELVKGWIAASRVIVCYHYQKNGGMHTAHNAAYERIDTELNVCVDSDDWLVDDAVEKITRFWRQYGTASYSGIIAVNASPSGEVRGSFLPRNCKDIRLSEFYAKGGRGDKKLIYRTEVMRQYPAYPVFLGEKYVPSSYKYLLADQDYSLLILNEVVCVVEYQQDGASFRKIQAYRNNPQGFVFIRKVEMVLGVTLWIRFKAAVHYVAKSIMLCNCNFIKGSPRKFLTILAVPAGILLFFYISRTKRRSPFNSGAQTFVKDKKDLSA